MDSPLLEPRPCPSCPGLIAGADPHRLCFECLGPDHALDGLTQSPACNACRMLPRLSRRHRLEHFQAYYVSPEEAEDQYLEVVEMEDQDVAGEVPFVFAIPASRAAPFVEEEDDEDALCFRVRRPGGSATQVCASRLPCGDDHGAGSLSHYFSCTLFTR